MAQFIIRRTFYALITLLILSFTIFTVVRLTGDPVTLLAEPGRTRDTLSPLAMRAVDHVRRRLEREGYDFLREEAVAGNG